MTGIETCGRCGYPVDPSEGNLERNTQGDQHLMHSLTRCFQIVNQALNDLGWPMERRAKDNIGGQPRGGRERDPTQKET